MANTVWQTAGSGIHNRTLLHLELANENLTSSTYDEFKSSLTRTGDILAGIHLALVCILTTVGNFLIIFLSKKNGRSFKPIDKLIINIAVSDLLTGLFGYPLPMISSFRHRWTFGTIGCSWYAFLTFTSGTVSMVSIAFVAIFRYIIISRKSSESSFSRRVTYAVAFSWIYGVVWSSCPFIGWGAYTLEPFRTACSVDWVSTALRDKTYVSSIMVTVFGVPFTITVCCYIAIARRLYRHQVHLRQSRQRNNSTFTQFRTENRLIVTALAVTCCYLFSWTPYALAALILNFVAGSGGNLSASFSFFPAMFAKTSTIYNPIIYYIFNKQFRADAVKMLCRCGCKMFHYNVNINEEWCVSHSGGMRIIVNGRTTNYRVVLNRPIFRQVRKTHEGEPVIPAGNLRAPTSIKHESLCEGTSHMEPATVSGYVASRMESHVPLCVVGAEAHIVGAEAHIEGAELEHTTQLFPSSAIWSDELPGQISYTTESCGILAKARSNATTQTKKSKSWCQGKSR